MRFKQGLCVVLALATACMSSVLLVQAAVTEPAEISNAAKTYSPRSPNDNYAPDSDMHDALLVSLYAEQLESGAVIDILTPNRTQLQHLIVNDRHEAVADAIPPGKYIAENRDLGSVLFLLHENASLSVLGGCGWTDGEILHLSDNEIGTLNLFCYVPVSKVDPEDGLCCTYSLIGEQYVSDRILHFTVETAQKDGYYVQSCSFAGLPEGSYTLVENGTECQRITISADESSIRIRRYPPENMK
ncbi:MAG: hypothetical protein MJ085_06350 [Clostridia bacterium]|nr:hypothetical protein [Clostridia bacterium]